MNDDALAQLRARMREDHLEDARWEAVASGSADAETLAELERRAVSEPEVAQMLEACRPLGDGVEAKIAARLAPSTEVVTGKPVAKFVAVASAPAPTGRPLAVLLARRVAMIAGPIAVAAGAFLYVATSGGPNPTQLPGYTITASGEQAMRGSPETSARLRLRGGPDARFEILARPETRPEPVVAYAFAMQGGEPVALEARIAVAPEGAVRISGAARSLEGARELRIVIGTSTAIGRYEGALARAKGHGDGLVRVLVVPIERE